MGGVKGALAVYTLTQTIAILLINDIHLSSISVLQLKSSADGPLFTVNPSKKSQISSFGSE